jgi:hypothetical protein
MSMEAPTATTEDGAGVLTADDRLEILQLHAQYSLYEDTGHSAAWAGLWTADGSFLGKRGDIVAGRENLLRFARERWQRPESRNKAHWVSNIIITPSPGGAACMSYGMLVEKTADGYRILQVQGKKDELRRVDGRWRFHFRESWPII